MYKINHQQKLDLRKIERWAVRSLKVEWNDWFILSDFLGWIRSELPEANWDQYQNDHDCKLCTKTTYTESERLMFNKIRTLYFKYNV